ncbi:T9SS type A sorting domain-containing protein [Reichenbachiella ulvae]|uniref:T9SS type A sorting domain-containing protein n=1 Tax=Reichenbachiella ulvae TaxID=2980104 RepID=UPI00384D17A9
MWNNTGETPNNGDYGYFSGTSAAAAYVTGTIALLFLIPSNNFFDLILKNPAKSALQVKKAILNNKSMFESFAPGQDSISRLNVSESLFSLCSELREMNLIEVLQAKSKLVSVYPNPFQDMIAITLESQLVEKLYIDSFTMEGVKVMGSTKIISRSGLQTIRVVTSTLSGGIYILRISSSTYSTTQLIIKK